VVKCKSESADKIQAGACGTVANGVSFWMEACSSAANQSSPWLGWEGEVANGAQAVSVHSPALKRLMSKAARLPASTSSSSETFPQWVKAVSRQDWV